jgi:hypothetical protein
MFFSASVGALVWFELCCIHDAKQDSFHNDNSMMGMRIKQKREWSVSRELSLSRDRAWS